MLALAAAPGAVRPAGPDPADDPFMFFRPYLLVTADEREALDRGEVIGRVLPARDRELAIFAVAALNVPADRIVDRARNIADFKQSPFVLQIQRFSDPPRLEDLARLTLDRVDVEAIQRCRPGRCKVKLGADEMRTLQRVAASSRGDRAALDAAFRALVLERVHAYLARGHRGLPEYRDHAKPVNLAETFSTLLKRFPFLGWRVPEVQRYLDDYPEAPLAGAESFLYWSKEKVALKPVVSVTHVTIVRGNGRPALPDVLVVSKQVFGLHYTDASLGLTALLADGASSRQYLAYVNRTFVDGLEGPLGGLKRLIVERRMREDTRRVFATQVDRLQQ